MYALKTALSIIFNPPEGFRKIKRDRKNFGYGAPIVIFFLIMICRIAVVYLTHYPLQIYPPEYTDFYQEVAIIIIPMLLWSVGNYLITSINNGENLLRETIAGTAYSFLPYILLSIPIALFSNILESSSWDNYGLAQTIMWGWCFGLVFIGMSVMNSYGLLRSIVVAVVSLLACIFILALIALLFILGMKVVDFFVKIFQDWRYLILTGGGR